MREPHCGSAGPELAYCEDCHAHEDEQPLAPVDGAWLCEDCEDMRTFDGMSDEAERMNERQQMGLSNF
jgi:hypothetical protein